MELLPFPLCNPSTLQEEASQPPPLHDIRELFELAFPLLNERARTAEDDTWVDNVIPLKP